MKKITDNTAWLQVFVLVTGIFLSGCDGAGWQIEQVVDTSAPISPAVSCLDMDGDQCAKQQAGIGNARLVDPVRQMALPVEDGSVPVKEVIELTVESQPTSAEDNRRPLSVPELSQQALYDDDAQQRVIAVNSLAHYRDEVSTATLLQSASDPDAAIRYQAIQTLRYAVADGLDTDGRITTVLHQALLDGDLRVADLARQIDGELKKSREGDIADH